MSTANTLSFTVKKTTKRMVCGAMLLVNERDGVKFLVVKERSWPVRDRKWGLPKGKLEEGETLWGAMIREVKEEVGVDLCSTPYVVVGCCKHSGIFVAMIL